MNDIDRKHIWITSIIVFGILALCVSIGAWHCFVIKTYTAAGYTRTTLLGSDFTHWVKDVNAQQ